MVGKMDYSSVPTSADLEQNSNKKYTINETPKGKLLISKLVCCFLLMAALLLAALAAIATFFLLPNCADGVPEALTSTMAVQKNKDSLSISNTRLPKSLQPTHYKLQIVPFLQVNNYTTKGFVTIEMHARQDTNKIVVNLNDIKVDKDEVRVRPLKEGGFLRINDQTYDEIAQTYTIQLDRPMRKGEKYAVDMKFVGHLNDLMQGFYRSKYVDSRTQEERWLAITQFSPTDARRAFPCFDEPAFKATFSVILGRQTNMTSLSNMPKVITEPNNDDANYVWDHYEKTPVMSTYLLAFAVSDLQPYEIQTADKLFRIWTRKDAIDQAVYGSEIGPKLLNYFEKYFNIKYPLPKMDMVAVPDFGFSAMENWGLITFRESALLYDNKITAIEDKRFIALVMAHELSHQWFGNLITPQWWDDLWLKEGFASYFEYMGVNDVEPSWNITKEFIATEIRDAFEIDALMSSRPISFEVHSSNQIRQTFDKISYCKGASIIRMLKHFIGEETFHSGLIHFLKTHKFGSVKHEDLWNAITDKAHGISALDPNVTVQEIMDTWAEQAGFPVVTAIANYKEKRVHVSQRRFFITGEIAKSEQTWWIPISYATARQPDFENTHPQIWIKNENETEFDLDTNSWWLLNLQHTGYYIVNYDEANWRKLSGNYLNFPSTIRAQLLSNSMDLARANLLDYDVPFNLLLLTGRRDNSLVPMLVALDKMEFLHDILITTPIFYKFDNFLLGAFQERFDNAALIENPSDSYETQRLRKHILNWACKRSSSRCVNHSLRMFRDWMANSQTIPPNIRDVVYCTAIREGTDVEWDFAYDQYLKTHVIADKNIFLEALGCTTKHWLLTRYLSYIIDEKSGIRKQDGHKVFESVAKNLVGNSLAFDFLRTNWKALNDYYGVAFNRISKMVLSLTLYMNTPYQLEQLVAFKNDNELGTSEIAFETAVEMVKGNVEWMNKSYTSVEKFLNVHSEHFGYKK